MNKQPTRPVKARVYTATLRIYGTLHLPPQGDIASLFNNPRPYFPMTDCQIFRRGVAHPPEQTDLTSKPSFLIIPKDTVLWVTANEGNAPLPAGRDSRNLYVLYPDSEYALKGEFPIAAGVRISDFLVRSFNDRSFHYLYRAELRLPGGGQDLVRARAVESFEVVTVNLRNVAGVFDVSEESSGTQFLGFS